MRLGTAVVAVCWAELLETNNNVTRAITTAVLKRRMETPPENGNRFRAPAHREKLAVQRRGEPRTTRAALNQLVPRGKASLLLLLRERSADYMQKFPARVPNN